MGINLKEHDIRFEEDNWESPTLGAWGIGWQVLLDGLEITQFTYFQQCGGVDLDPVSVELTYGLDRIAAYLQGVENVYDVMWSKNDDLSPGAPGRGAAVFGLQLRPRGCGIDAQAVRFDRSRGRAPAGGVREDKGRSAIRRFPVLQAYDLCLKCSHLFNVLDARGAISVTERAAMIGRVRKLATQVARAWLDQRAAVGSATAGVTRMKPTRNAQRARRPELRRKSRSSSARKARGGFSFGDWLRRNSGRNDSESCRGT